MKTLDELFNELNEAKLNYWKSKSENRNETLLNVELIKSYEKINYLEKNVDSSNEEINQLKIKLNLYEKKIV